MKEYNTLKDALPMTSRVWVYMSDRRLTDEETEELAQRAVRFVQGWAAHGIGLNAHAEVRFNQFLILMVDEGKNMASGCSIDSSVQFVREAGTELKVDFFNRLLAAYTDESGNICTLPIAELRRLFNEGRIHPSSTVFNNLVQTRQALEEQWEIPLENSPYAPRRRG